jgi:hypothetical protein
MPQPLPNKHLTRDRASRIAEAWQCVAKAAAWAEADCSSCRFVVATLVHSARWEQQFLGPEVAA